MAKIAAYANPAPQSKALAVAFKGGVLLYTLDGRYVVLQPELARFISEELAQVSGLVETATGSFAEAMLVINQVTSGSAPSGTIH